MSKKILIIDDDINWRETMKNILESKGLVVETAPDGQQGISMARSGQPDLIVLDNKMPSMTGQEVAKIIRKDPETRQIPVIMVTGMELNQSMIDYIRMDVSDFLKKPFAVDVLVNKIEKMTGEPLRKEEKVDISPAGKIKIIAGLRKPESMSRLSLLLGDSAEIVKAENAAGIIENIKKEIPGIIIGNYISLGLGTQDGLKLLYAALLNKVPVVIDVADILKSESGAKLDESGSKYYFLEPVNTDTADSRIKALAGKLDIV